MAYDSDPENEEDASESGSEASDASEESEPEDYILTLDFKDIWAIDFLESVNKKYRFPRLKEVHIDNVPTISSQLKIFLKHTLTTVEEFHLNKKCLPEFVSQKVDIEYYFDTLLNLIPNIEDGCLLGYFSMT